MAGSACQPCTVNACATGAEVYLEMQVIFARFWLPCAVKVIVKKLGVVADEEVLSIR